ncbi:MAG: methyltransferase, partial [Candidatus Eiseniibacteriota bacterium]
MGSGPSPTKDHPQYGNRIPPEELELMRELAQETARGSRSQPYTQRRPMGPSTGPRPQSTRDSGYARGGPMQRPQSPAGNMGPRPDRPPRRDRPPQGRKPYRTGVQSAGEGPPRPAPLPEEPALGRFRKLLSGYQMTAALSAAYTNGIFAELHRQPQSAEDVARACAIDPRGTEILLDALVAIGVLHRHGPTYVVPRDMATYLVPGLEGDTTGLIEMAPDWMHAWSDLGRGLKDGSPRYRLTSEAILTGDRERVRRYIRAVHTASREAARRVAEMSPLLPGSSLLDIGGGSGIFAAEFARRTPELKAYLFDLPPTLDVARTILQAEGLEDTIEYVPGDYRHDPFPGPVDAVLVSNVFQTESEENALLILKKAHEALRPGGTLLVHGAMSESTGPPPPAVALHSLQMFVLFDE